MLPVLAILDLYYRIYSYNHLSPDKSFGLFRDDAPHGLNFDLGTTRSGCAVP